MSDKIENKLMVELMQSLNSADLSFATLCSAVVNLAKLAEKYDGMISGVQKKELVIGSLREYVENDHIPDEEQGAMLMFINKALPAMIDVIIALDKTSFVIKIKENGFWCCSRKKKST
jgi:Asp-tRNA(Asn)/Glu-tRNA(Gln) amidotransferase B subunit